MPAWDAIPRMFYSLAPVDSLWFFQLENSTRNSLEKNNPKGGWNRTLHKMHIYLYEREKKESFFLVNVKRRKKYDDIFFINSLCCFYFVGDAVFCVHNTWHFIEVYHSIIFILLNQIMTDFIFFFASFVLSLEEFWRILKNFEMRCRKN